MKLHKIIISLCCMALTSLVNIGCSEDNNAPIETTITVNGATGQKCAQPIDWQIPTDKQLYPQSMFFMIDTDGVPGTMAEGDMLAAFIDGTCHGACLATTGTDDYTRCMLKVVLFQEEAARRDLKVELRYYSVANGVLFTAQPVPFEEDDIKGGYRTSYRPNWK